GMNKDEALYQAKLTFLKQEDFSTLHPHYWAGFVSIGDTQPIKKGRNWGILLIFGSVLLVFGSVLLIWKKIKK
ncbi:MAG: CHAT domain-containing protein, partial [Saprospiraceae bacterium]